MDPSSENPQPSLRPEGRRFATTMWSVVAQAGEEDSTVAREALQKLCSAYWYPLYAFVREKGYSEADSQDLTQEFFLQKLKKKSIPLADENRGRFRNFLLASLDHFLINEWNKAKREKRGGGVHFVSLNADETETRFRAEPATGSLPPDKAFERRWAWALVENVLNQLEAEFAAGERAHVFNELKPTLTGEELEDTYAVIGERLGMSESNVKVTKLRLRDRYFELLREEIGRTVLSPEQIDEEMRDLMAALSY